MRDADPEPEREFIAHNIATKRVELLDYLCMRGPQSKPEACASVPHKKSSSMSSSSLKKVAKSGCVKGISTSFDRGHSERGAFLLGLRQAASASKTDGRKELENTNDEFVKQESSEVPPTICVDDDLGCAELQSSPIRPTFHSELKPRTVGSHESTENKGKKTDGLLPQREKSLYETKSVARRLDLNGGDNRSNNCFSQISSYKTLTKPVKLLAVSSVPLDKETTTTHLRCNSDWIPKEPSVGSPSNSILKRKHDNSNSFEETSSVEKKRVYFTDPPSTSLLEFHKVNLHRGTVFSSPNDQTRSAEKKHPSSGWIITGDQESPMDSSISTSSTEKSPNKKFHEVSQSDSTQNKVRTLPLSAKDDASVKLNLKDAVAAMSVGEISDLLQGVDPAIFKELVCPSNQNRSPLVAVSDLCDYLLQKSNVKALPAQCVESAQNIILNVMDVNVIVSHVIRAINDDKYSQDALELLMASVLSKLHSKKLFYLLCETGLKLC